MFNVIFFVRHFYERGTEVSIYDYAKYNEEILGNKSYIVCFTMRKRQNLGYFWTCNATYEKFSKRFKIFEIDEIENVSKIVIDNNINFFYTLTQGKYEREIYQFHNKQIWQNCKTIKHCVFDTRGPESDYYCCINNYLNVFYDTNIPVLPHMIDLPNHNLNLREILNIPENSLVFGGYGGHNSFNYHIARSAVYKVAKSNPNIYFLFANFDRFCEDLPNMIYLPCILDLHEKVKFINTCDAMIWGRTDGEIMSIAQGEFCSKNKPIITTEIGELGHKYLLRDKAIWYTDEKSLIEILTHFNREEIQNKNWNAYENFTPQNVMNQFNEILLKL